MFDAFRAARVSSDAPPTPSELRLRLPRAVFNAAASSAFHHAHFLSEWEREGVTSLSPEEAAKSLERRFNDFTANALGEHLRAVALESARITALDEQESHEPRRFFAKEADILQLYWCGQTMALAATISALEGRNSPVCTESLPAPPLRDETQETIHALREAFPVLGEVLLDIPDSQPVAASDGEKTDVNHHIDEDGHEMDEEEEGKEKKSRFRLWAGQHHNVESGAKRMRCDEANAMTSSEQENSTSPPRSGKRPFAFSVQVGGFQPQHPQHQQQQQQHSVNARRQATLAFDSNGVLGLAVQAHPSPTLQNAAITTTGVAVPRLFSTPYAPLSPPAHNRAPDCYDEEHSYSSMTESKSLGGREYRRGNRAPGYPPTGGGFNNNYINNQSHYNNYKGGDFGGNNSNNNNNNNSRSTYSNNNNDDAVGSSGFVTASEQLAADVRSGRSIPPSLPRRTPALGLRRSGFTPPFQQHQQPQSLSQPPPQPHQQQQRGDGECGVGDVLTSITSKSRGTKAQRAAASRRAGSEEDDRGEFPTSLLLPDGSVPPILLPLEPKLVAQVAMEILEHGAGTASVGWDDIAGLEHAKRSVEEAIVWPLRRPDLFVGLRDPPRGLLLFGPPGTGKTMIARAIANRAQCTFLNISASSLMSKWMGDGEKLVRCLFAVATVKQPSVIFIDEIDSLLSMRGEGEMDSVRRVKTEFLVQLDGVATDRGDRVLLIGATNRPDELDEAARRRMEKRLYIPLPDMAARADLIKRLMRTMDVQQQQQQHTADCEIEESLVKIHELNEQAIVEIATATEGYSGADLKQICREAAMGPLREVTSRLVDVSASDLRPIQRRDFLQALRRIKPSVGVSEVTRYVEWNEQFGSFSLQPEGAAVDFAQDEEFKMELCK